MTQVFIVLISSNKIYGFSLIVIIFFFNLLMIKITIIIFSIYRVKNNKKKRKKITVLGPAGDRTQRCLMGPSGCRTQHHGVMLAIGPNDPATIFEL
jgi:hypothetical protein